MVLGNDNGPVLPPWASAFVLDGGSPADWLAFRVDDWYLITEAGADLNLRDSPSLEGAVIRQLQINEYLWVVDGPVNADGFIWWKVALSMWADSVTGWVGESQEWYERAWGQ